MVGRIAKLSILASLQIGLLLGAAHSESPNQPRPPSSSNNEPGRLNPSVAKSAAQGQIDKIKKQIEDLQKLITDPHGIKQQIDDLRGKESEDVNRMGVELSPNKGWLDAISNLGGQRLTQAGNELMVASVLLTVLGILAGFGGGFFGRYIRSDTIKKAREQVDTEMESIKKELIDPLLEQCSEKARESADSARKAADNVEKASRSLGTVEDAARRAAGYLPKSLQIVQKTDLIIIPESDQERLDLLAELRTKQEISARDEIIDGFRNAENAISEGNTDLAIKALQDVEKHALDDATLLSAIDNQATITAANMNRLYAMSFLEARIDEFIPGSATGFVIASEVLEGVVRALVHIGQFQVELSSPNHPDEWGDRAMNRLRQAIELGGQSPRPRILDLVDRAHLMLGNLHCRKGKWNKTKGPKFRCRLQTGNQLVRIDFQT